MKNQDELESVHIRRNIQRSETIRFQKQQAPFNTLHYLSQAEFVERNIQRDACRMVSIQVEYADDKKQRIENHQQSADLEILVETEDYHRDKKEFTDEDSALRHDLITLDPDAQDCCGGCDEDDIIPDGFIELGTIEINIEEIKRHLNSEQ